MKTLNIGFNNFVIDEHVISIIVPDTAPARRLREDAKNRDSLIDATAGRKTDSEEVIKKRLENALKELEFENKYDYTVINEDIEDSCQKLIEIINE